MTRSGSDPRLLWIFIVLAMTMLPARLATAKYGDFTQFGKLLAAAGSHEETAPLLEFGEYSEGFDPEIFSANRDYLRKNGELIKRIRSDLGPGDLAWTLERAVGRLLFVPESRVEYGALFEWYCKDAVRFILEQTGLENPYSSIETLDREMPQMADDGRIRAFLVNNVAKEFIATNLFSAPDNRKVKIDVRGRVFIGELGSFASELVRRQNTSFGFVRNKYTIWQNNAKNPYSALIPPMEETLHIALRPYTEMAVLKRIHEARLSEFDAIRPIVSQWLAIEEAVAGGVVHQVAPPFFSKEDASLPGKILNADIETKREFYKYRYLKAGIALVKKFGAKGTLKLYQEDPTRIEKMLM